MDHGGLASKTQARTSSKTSTGRRRKNPVTQSILTGSFTAFINDSPVTSRACGAESRRRGLAVARRDWLSTLANESPRDSPLHLLTEL